MSAIVPSGAEGRSRHAGERARSASHHPLFRRLFAAPPRLCTTPLVIAEGHGWFLRRYDRPRGMEFLSFVEMLTPLTVFTVGPAEVAAATRLMRRHSDQSLTLADAAGLHLMHVRKTRTCWSTDFHRRLSGVPPGDRRLSWPRFDIELSLDSSAPKLLMQGRLSAALAWQRRQSWFS
jgi:hypothetical protein